VASSLFQAGTGSILDDDQGRALLRGSGRSCLTSQRSGQTQKHQSPVALNPPPKAAGLSHQPGRGILRGLGLFLSSFVKTSCEFSQKARIWLHTLASAVRVVTTVGGLGGFLHFLRLPPGSPGPDTSLTYSTPLHRYGPALLSWLSPGRVPLGPAHIAPSCVRHTLPHATGPMRYSPKCVEEEFSEVGHAQKRARAAL
jgi:hypothetical protein